MRRYVVGMCFSRSQDLYYFDIIFNKNKTIASCPKKHAFTLSFSGLVTSSSLSMYFPYLSESQSLSWELFACSAKYKMGEKNMPSYMYIKTTFLEESKKENHLSTERK